MAIDNNKLYNLKGSQVKELASKIKATEYNFSTGLRQNGKNVSIDDIITIYTANIGVETPWVYLKDVATNDNDFWMQLNTKDNFPILRLADSVGAEIDIPTITYVDRKIGAKQDTLVSGTNIKTINNQSLLGEGNIDISGGNANFTLDTTNNFAVIQSQTQGISFQLDDANGVTVTASDPGTYQNVKKLATQDYVDSKAGGTIDVAPGDDKFTINDPDGINSATLQVGGAGILMDISGSEVAELASKTYVDSHSSGAFIVDTSNPCSYNELQNAINTPSVILIKHEGKIYPFVEKWESDENTKRYVNIASLQRQTVDKGAMYFFFEATIGDFDSPMVYSSNFAQATGKPYTDNIAGNLSDLTTTEKTNLVGAVNEVNGKTGMNLEVGKERWHGTYTDENGVTYQVYSKVVFIPALPATAGITKYDHGVSNIKQILSIYGFTTDGFVLNAPRQTASDNIAIYQASKSPTNQTFSIEVGKDRSSKQAYVTMIYAKNN